jgi:hypothetical protein
MHTYTPNMQRLGQSNSLSECGVTNQDNHRPPGCETPPVGVRLSEKLGRTFSRKYAPDAAGRIRNVAGIPRNEMNVDVHTRLTRGGPNVHTDVVSVRRILGLDERTCSAEELDNGHLFRTRHFKEIGYMPPGHDDDMAAT